MYASGAFSWVESQNASTLRRLDCMTAVPILPVEAPMIADGLRANELAPHGREAQSMAFLRRARDASGCTRARRTGRR